MTNRTELSGVAMRMRHDILAQADMFQAMGVGNAITDSSLDAFNAAGTTVATSIIARAMVIKAQLEVAAHWLMDVSGAPLPECFAMIRSLVDDPPPGMEGTIWTDPNIVRENGK